SSSDSAESRRAVALISASGISTREVSAHAKMPAASTTQPNAMTPATITLSCACSCSCAVSTAASTLDPLTRTVVPGGSCGTPATVSSTMLYAAVNTTARSVKRPRSPRSCDIARLTITTGSLGHGTGLWDPVPGAHDRVDDARLAQLLAQRHDRHPHRGGER